MTTSLIAAMTRKAETDRALASANADMASKQAVVADYQRALEDATAAIAANATIERARELADEQRVAEAELTAARNQLREATDARAFAVAQARAAAEAVECAEAEIDSAHLSEIAAQRRRVWEEDDRLAYLLIAATQLGITTDDAEGARDNPGQRLTSETMTTEMRVVKGLHSSVDEKQRQLDAALDYWRKFQSERRRAADLEARHASDQERAA